jgi:hypothetical protein
VLEEVEMTNDALVETVPDTDPEKAVGVEVAKIVKEN